MRIALLLLGLSLPLSALAYEGEEYPEMYENQGEVYPEETYPEEMPVEEPYQEQAPVEDMPMEEPIPQEQEQMDPAAQQQAHETCQQYAAELPPEDQAAYIMECMTSQGF